MKCDISNLSQAELSYAGTQPTTWQAFATLEQNKMWYVISHGEPSYAGTTWNVMSATYHMVNWATLEQHEMWCQQLIIWWTEQCWNNMKCDVSNLSSGELSNARTKWNVMSGTYHTVNWAMLEQHEMWCQQFITWWAALEQNEMRYQQLITQWTEQH